MQLTRRKFLQAGLAGVAALAAIRAIHGPFLQDEVERGGRYLFLRPAERGMLAAIAPVILAGALPTSPGAGKPALDNVLLDIDRTLSGFDPNVQGEVRDLFSLLLFPPARWLLAGVRRPWSEAGTADIAAFLQDWRLSRWQLLQSAYHALHDVVLAAWYAQPAAWPATGYAGPPQLGQP